MQYSEGALELTTTQNANRTAGVFSCAEKQSSSAKSFGVVYKAL